MSDGIGSCTSDCQRGDSAAVLRQSNFVAACKRSFRCDPPRTTLFEYFLKSLALSFTATSIVAPGCLPTLRR